MQKKKARLLQRLAVHPLVIEVGLSKKNMHYPVSLQKLEGRELDCDICCTSARCPSFGMRYSEGSDPGGGSGGSLGGIGNADGRKPGRVDCCVPAGSASPSVPLNTDLVVVIDPLVIRSRRLGEQTVASPSLEPSPLLHQVAKEVVVKTMLGHFDCASPVSFLDLLCMVDSL